MNSSGVKKKSVRRLWSYQWYKGYGSEDAVVYA